VTPVEPTFAPLIGIIAMFEGDGAKLPAAFLSNEANHGTAMMVVLARILCLSVGITFGSSASVEQSAWAPRSPFAARRSLVPPAANGRLRRHDRNVRVRPLEQ